MINYVIFFFYFLFLYRAFGPLVNVEAFYNAFEVKEGDQHYKKPEERIKIW